MAAVQDWEGLMDKMLDSSMVELEETVAKEVKEEDMVARVGQAVVKVEPEMMAINLRS